MSEKLYPREAPSGYTGPVSLLNVSLKDLRYGDKVQLRVGGGSGREVSAVVDLGVSSIHGSPLAAVAFFITHGGVYPHLKRKLVWQEGNGSWSGRRDVGTPTMGEFRQWMDGFNRNKPPTPMP